MSDVPPQYDANGNIVGFPAPAQYGAHAAPSIDREAARSMSRQRVQAMRRLEAEGVPFYLHRTGLEATVRSISFADKVMLTDLPQYLQAELQAAYGQYSNQNKTKTIADMARSAGNDERIANALCVAGFLVPRLTLSKDEADRANDDNVWWVGDLHIDERKRYMQIVLGNGSEEDLKRIAGFLDSRLQSVELG